MSTLLRDAKTYYNDFFEKDTWSDELADKTLDGLRDKNKRKECIRETYNLILEATDISEAVKLWIKRGYSIQDTAIKCGVSSDTIKNQSYYINKTLGKDLTFEKDNILKLCLKHNEIVKNHWEEINKRLQTVITKRRSKAENIGRLLDNRSLLINIPRKEYKTEIDETEFNMFLRLIQPYFINERKRTQQEINEKYLDAAGYLNYIMTPGIELSSNDKRRLDKVKSLLDSNTLKDFKKLSREKVTNILNIVEEPVPAVSEDKKVKHDIYPKSIRIQFNC
ncbi:MAG: hypothetical protein K1W35_13050 [Lachnospiraceae bacterium]